MTAVFGLTAANNPLVHLRVQPPPRAADGRGQRRRVVLLRPPRELPPSASSISATRTRVRSGVIAAGLELGGDVDEPAGVDDEVGRVQDAARGEPVGERRRPRAGCSPHRRSRAHRTARPCARRARRPARTARARPRPPQRLAGPPSGRRQLRGQRRACARRRRPAPAARRPPRGAAPAARRRARSRRSRRCPASSGEPNRRRSRRAIAASTPSAVNGLGSPLPPRRRAGRSRGACARRSSPCRARSCRRPRR